MQTRKLIDGASFGPDALKTIGLAFDEAWPVIAGNFSADTTEGGRQRLAKALLSVATDERRDSETLKLAALKAMALTYYANQSDRTSN